MRPTTRIAPRSTVTAGDGPGCRRQSGARQPAGRRSQRQHRHTPRQRPPDCERDRVQARGPRPESRRRTRDRPPARSCARAGWRAIEDWRQAQRGNRRSPPHPRRALTIVARRRSFGRSHHPGRQWQRKNDLLDREYRTQVRDVPPIRVDRVGTSGGRSARGRVPAAREALPATGQLQCRVAGAATGRPPTFAHGPGVPRSRRRPRACHATASVRSSGTRIATPNGAEPQTAAPSRISRKRAGLMAPS